MQSKSKLPYPGDGDGDGDGVDTADTPCADIDRTGLVSGSGPAPKVPRAAAGTCKPKFGHSIGLQEPNYDEH